MADRPWTGRLLTPGQVAQRPEGLHCSKFEERLPNAQLWRAPGGKVFWISLDECDAEYLEGIVDQIKRWVDEDRDGK
jgi:hypothetical protein